VVEAVFDLMVKSQSNSTKKPSDARVNEYEQYKPLLGAIFLVFIVPNLVGAAAFSLWSFPLWVQWVQTLIFLGGLPIAALAWAHKVMGLSLDYLGLKKPLHYSNTRILLESVGIFILYQVLVFIVWPVVNVVLRSVDYAHTSEVSAVSRLDAGVEKILEGIVLSIQSPVLEEIFLRAILFYCMYEKGWPTRTWKYIVLSGLLFGVSHAPAGLAWIVVFTLIGFIDAYIFSRTRTVISLIVAHGAYNFSVLFF